MFWLLQAFLTCRENFIWTVFDVWPDDGYIQNFCICLYILCICSLRNRKLLHPFVPTSQNIIQVGLFTILLYLMCASASLTSWMTSEFHSYVSLQVLYVFCDVPTSFWYLVDVWTVIYILVGFKHISMVIIRPYNGLGWHFPVIATLEIISSEPLLNWYT